MSFKSELVVKECPDGKWELVEDLIYDGNRDTFIVPAGFKTDFASVPRVFWNIIPPTSPRYTKAAVLHDWFYAKQGVTRSDADGLFRRIMRDSGVGKVKRGIMWLAVRAFGWLSWKK